MGTGYVRQSAADIITGAVVEAAPLNLEFNQLRDAFHETSGHSHDGTTGEGPKIALTTSISGVLPVVNGGFAAIHKINGTTAPTANEDSNDGYGVGSVWLDTTNDRAYICVDSTVAAAVWLTVGTATGFQPLDTDLTAIAALTSAADKMPYATGAGTWALADLSTFARTLLDDANAAALLTTLGITSSVAELNYTDGVTSAIQTQLDAKQALDADLTALAALSGTNTIYYRSAANTWTAVTIGGNLTFTGGTLDAVASSLDATLTSIAALGSGADKGIYFTGVDTAAEFTLTSFARTLLDDVDASTARTTLGLAIGTNVQAYDAELAALAGLTSAADSMPYFTGAGTAALATVTSFARTLLDDANQAAARTTLGLTPGTDVQAYDNTLTELAAISGVAGDIIYADGSDSWTRLAKGTAAQILTMNAGATAPEWGTPASFTAATQAEQEAGSSTTVGTTPGRQQYHPSAAKCWGVTTGGGSPSLAANYNMTSITDAGTGDLTCTIATDFSSATYAVTMSITSNTPDKTGISSSLAAGSFKIKCTADPDQGYGWACFGDQT